MATTTGISFDGVDDTLQLTYLGPVTTNPKKYTIAGGFEATADGEAPGLVWTSDAGGSVQFGMTSTSVNPLTGIISDKSPYFLVAADPSFTGLVLYELGANSYTYGVKYFFMISVDTTQATAANRCKMWYGPYGGTVAQISGWTDKRLPLFGSASALNLNDIFERDFNAADIYDLLGWDGSTFYKGRAADIYYIDGTALADPSSLLTNYATAAAPGTYAGSYGNAGYHLDFSNAGSLGADSSGHGFNWDIIGGPTQLTGYFAGASGVTLSAGAGSYSQTGTAAGTKRGRKAAAASGSYTQNGTAAGTKRARKAAAGSGSYGLTGTAAAVTKAGKKVVANAGSYSQAGVDAGIKRTRRPIAGAGSYSQVGTGAVPKRALKGAAGAGSYSQNGTNAGTKVGKKVGAVSGSYGLSGAVAALLAMKKLAAGAGSYGVSGVNAAITRSQKRLAAGLGSYALLGTAADITPGDAPVGVDEEVWKKSPFRKRTPLDGF